MQHKIMASKAWKKKRKDEVTEKDSDDESSSEDESVDSESDVDHNLVSFSMVYHHIACINVTVHLANMKFMMIRSWCFVLIMTIAIPGPNQNPAIYKKRFLHRTFLSGNSS